MAKKKEVKKDKLNPGKEILETLQRINSHVDKVIKILKDMTEKKEKTSAELSDEMIEAGEREMP